MKFEERFWHPKSAPRAAKSGPRAAKSGPRAAKSGSRAAKSGQERPKSGPRATKSGQERPKSSQESPKSGQKCPEGGPRAARRVIFGCFLTFYDDFVKITLWIKYNEQIRNKRVKITNKTKQYVEDV